jgi:protein-disulfide isomerase
MNKQTKIILGVVLVLALGAVAFSYLRAPSSTDTAGGAQVNTNLPAVTDADWQKKAEGSTVTIVEYADFQCPACAAYNPLVNRLKETYQGRVTFVFRHFPLGMHINAVPASLAAEAAGAQGKFFEMSDKLFAGQAEWSESKAPNEIFTRYATELGLNIDQFTADIARDDLKQKIADSYKGGIRAKVTGTPTFFINGEKIANPRGGSLEEVYVEFTKLIDAKLGTAATATTTPSSSTSTTAN